MENEEVVELTKELISFLEQTNKLEEFLQWTEERGFDREQMETDFELIQNS